jgi:hypothetical protein
MGRVQGAEFLSLKEFAEFASRQGKEGVELPDRLKNQVHSSWTWINLRTYDISLANTSTMADNRDALKSNGVAGA